LFVMYSITAALLLAPCVSHRIMRDSDVGRVEVDVKEESSLTSSRRRTAAEPVQRNHHMQQGAGDAVDWHFMTPEVATWMGRGGQETYDTVQGHACQTRGRYDDSYYASSMCYWSPDAGSRNSNIHWGLNWQGGYGATEFCQGRVPAPGTCARCSVCHDNSRDRDARVDADNVAGILEIIPLPNCMTDAAIEAECNQQFDGNNVEVLIDEARCREVQGRYDSSVADFNALTATITAAENAISQGIHQLATGFPQHDSCGDHTIQDIRAVAVRQCRSFGARNRQNNAQLLRNRPTCRSTAETNQTHQRCERCTGQMDTLVRAIRDHDNAQSHLTNWQERVTQHRQELTNHRQTLAQSHQQYPARLQQKAQQESEWFPQQQRCQQLYDSVFSARSSNMMTCAPSHYEHSCEKACVEIQRNGEHGCGVVEGSQYGDDFQRGGIAVTCAPPRPSWIKSPNNYGGSAEVNSGEQCGRINAEQSVRMTTPVLKSSFLTTPGRGWIGRDSTQFYVLESGNGVRSANLRVFDGALPDGTEGTNDGIIMWDAEEVTATETTRERACFEIKHRYDGRTTSWERAGMTKTLCVTSGNKARERDEWVSVLQGLRVWHPRMA